MSMLLYLDYTNHTESCIHGHHHLCRRNITLCTQGTCCQFCVSMRSPKGYTLPCWKVIIPIVSFLWHQREYPKAMSALHCKHHTVKLWSSLRLNSYQYKSCKILSGICCLILLSVFNSSICSTYIWGEMFLKVILHACSVNITVTWFVCADPQSVTAKLKETTKNVLTCIKTKGINSYLHWFNISTAKVDLITRFKEKSFTFCKIEHLCWDE